LLTVFKELVNLPQKFLTCKTAPHLCIIKQTQDKTKSKNTPMQKTTLFITILACLVAAANI
jgi:hypothetical protein